MKNTFTDQGTTALNPEEGTSSGGQGVKVPIHSEEERKLTWMYDTRIGSFMQMELMAFKDELNSLRREYHCASNNYLKEYCPPMPLLVFPHCHKMFGKKA